MRLCIFLALFAHVFPNPVPYCEDFRTASYYGDNMVLQQGPLKSVIWGYIGQEGVNVSAEFNTQVFQTTSEMGAEGKPLWRIELDPMSASETPYTITITSGECGSIVLSNVVFGDVYACSGQSNMAWRMDRIDDPQADIDDSVNYPYVRTFQAALQLSQQPEYDLLGVTRGWAEPTAANIAPFSAVCWLFGRNMYRDVGYPIGLVQTCWGGTRIEAWSSQETLDRCYPDGARPGEDRNEATVLYNAMIHPFLRMPIRGALWYQGESNVGQFDDYFCNLPDMIENWRNGWYESTNGNTDQEFSFGIVQLAGYRRSNEANFWAKFRWAQAGRQEHVPNEVLPNCFLAAAHDLPDFDMDPIHSRFKRQVAERLWINARYLDQNEEYGHKRYMGPIPKDFDRVGDRLVVDYGSEVELEYRDTVNSIHFDICCLNNPTLECNDWNYVNVPVIAEQNPQSLELDIPCTEGQVVMGVRYAWRESPCDTEQCAIYDKFMDGEIEVDMPAPTYQFEGLID